MREQRKESTQACQTIANWLSSVNYNLQQAEHSEARHSGACQWFIDLPQFQDWLIGDEQTLFCHGIPGAGKTILVSEIVDVLQTKFRNDSSIGIAYIYCEFKLRDEQDAGQLLVNLLKQLVLNRHSAPESVQVLYDHYKDRSENLPINGIQTTLTSVISTFSQVYIVIDALDELQPPIGNTQSFLSILLDIQSETGSKLIVTSRRIPTIEKYFKHCAHVEIQAHSRDIELYVESEIGQLRQFIRENPKLIEEIKAKTALAARGM